MNLSELSNAELIALKAEKEIEISKNHNIQLAKKILLNSCYGAMSNPYFLYYDDILAESITLSGQLSIKWIQVKMNLYVNKLLKTVGVDYVIAVDTDSLYMNFGPLVDHFFEDKSDRPKIVEFLDTFCKVKVAPYLEKCYTELAEMMNAFAQKMRMKRENIADIAIWTGKKRYIMNVWDSEGTRYKEPKQKLVGIEAIRSSTPFVVREYIKKAIGIIIKDDEPGMQAYIKDCRKTFSSLRFEEVGKPSGVNGMEKYADKNTLYKGGTPFHVRAALVYNKTILNAKLDKKFPLITNGNKIKYCYMKMPNPLHENAFAVSTVLPASLDLEKYIDYELQFEKTFIQPMKKILDAIGWSAEKRRNLKSYFNQG